MCEPEGAMSPPLASTAWEGRRTLLTRAIMVKIAESCMTVVSMLACARDLAMACPPKWGAPSLTITWNLRFLAAAFKNFFGMW